MAEIEITVVNTFKDLPYTVHIKHNNKVEKLNPQQDNNENIILSEGKFISIWSQLKNDWKLCILKIPMSPNQTLLDSQITIALEKNNKGQRKWIITNSTKKQDGREGDPKQINVNVGDDNQ
jgi:hypothetical protein